VQAAQQGNAARRSEARVSEPANLWGHCLRENKATQKELLHTTQEPEEEALVSPGHVERPAGPQGS
jgi:hypothetical protein